MLSPLSIDFEAQNINECVKMGERRGLCYAIMGTEHVKMCELFFLHVLLCRYMAAFEYWSTRVYVQWVYGSSLGAL